MPVTSTPNHSHARPPATGSPTPSGDRQQLSATTSAQLSPTPSGDRLGSDRDSEPSLVAAREDSAAIRTPQASDPSLTGARDIADGPAVEVITTTAVHLMSAAAVKLGLADCPEAQTDLDEARKLITSRAGLTPAGAQESSNSRARPRRDGLRSLQVACREASLFPDTVGQGPGEKWTGPVSSPHQNNPAPHRPALVPPSGWLQSNQERQG